MCVCVWCLSVSVTSCDVVIIVTLSAGLCLVMLVARDHFGADISRRRRLLLLITGSFYLVAGIFIFLLTTVQTIYDDIVLFSSPIARASNDTEHCGEQRFLYSNAILHFVVQLFCYCSVIFSAVGGF